MNTSWDSWIGIGDRLRVSERGASIVEYALLLALIAMVSIAALTTLGPLVGDQLDDGATGISGFQCRPAHEAHLHCLNKTHP
jgi:Flp pilus assembly pilin Flp